jgi:hypothetical protein
MTKSERRQVAATLREWAVPVFYGRRDVLCLPDGVYLISRPFWASGEGWDTQFHTGPTAATGLLLAAEAVEAGDVP